jgi:predicted RNA-binding protein with PIN domain
MKRKFEIVRFKRACAIPIELGQKNLTFEQAKKQLKDNNYTELDGRGVIVAFDAIRVQN